MDYQKIMLHRILKEMANKIQIHKKSNFTFTDIIFENKRKNRLFLKKSIHLITLSNKGQWKSHCPVLKGKENALTSDDIKAKMKQRCILRDKLKKLVEMQQVKTQNAHKTQEESKRKEAILNKELEAY